MNELRRFVPSYARRATIVVGALALVLAACAADEAEEPDAVEEPVTAEEPDPAEEPDAAEEPGETVTIGFMTPGDTNDGFFYQSHLRAVQDFADQEGWDLIWIDRVPPANALSEARNLALQGADVVVMTSPVEFRDALEEASAEFQDVTWIAVGTGEPPTEHFVTASQDYSEIHYLAGHAFGLYLQRVGSDTAGVVTGPELPFTLVVPVALELGLQQVIEDAEVLATYTGDFDDAGLAVEAARSQIAAGAGILYPFLGGATRGVLEEAMEAGVALAVQPEDACDAGFGISVLFAQGEYAKALLAEYRDGELEMGTRRDFRVGHDPEVGVRLCDATAEEQAILDEVERQIADGEIVPREMVEEILAN